MKKYTILAAILLSLVLFAGTSYCEELTAKDWEIYDEYTTEALATLKDVPYVEKDMAIEKLRDKYAAKYNISREKLDYILNKCLEEELLNYIDSKPQE